MAYIINSNAFFSGKLPPPIAGCRYTLRDYIRHKKGQKPCYYWSSWPSLDDMGFKLGGGGENRTRVRKSSTVGSTCVAASIYLAINYPMGRMVNSEPALFSSLSTGALNCGLM